MATNSQAGKAVLFFAACLFVYYFFWVSILPFMLIDEGNLIHWFFPPLEFAYILSAAFGVVFLGGITIFTLYHIWLTDKELIKAGAIFCKCGVFEIPQATQDDVDKRTLK